MATTLFNYKIFLASPGGLEDERLHFRDIVTDYNIEEANPRGFHITPVGWEETLGGIGRPQEIINKDLVECDFFILLLHDRWGSRTHKKANHKYSSGSEEEFYVALEALKNEKLAMKDIIVFFKSVNDRQLSDPGSELTKVLQFKNFLESEKSILYDTFENLSTFQKKIRRYLGSWIRMSIKDNNYFIKTNYFPSEINFPILENIPDNQSSDEEILEKAEALFLTNKLVNAELQFSQIAVRESYPYGLARYARFLYKIGQPERAMRLLFKTIKICSFQNNKLVEAYCYQLLGSVYNKVDESAKAIESFEKSIVFYASVKDKSGEAKSLLRLGFIYLEAGDFDKAILNFNKSYILYDELSDSKGRAIILGYTGLVYKNRCDFESAISFYCKGLKIHIDNGDLFNQAVTLSNLGVSYRLMGNLVQSKSFHEDSLKIMLQLSNNSGISREYTNLAIIEFNNRNYITAEDLLNQAYEVNEKAGLFYSMVFQLGNLGRIYAIRSEFARSLDLANKSLQLSEKFNLKSSIANQYLIHGEIYYLTGDYDVAIKYLNKSMQFLSTLGNQFELGRVFYYLYRIYLKQNNKSMALHFQSKYTILYNDINRKDIVESMDLENDFFFA